jgi:CheY-like chemotaxis protein
MRNLITQHEPPTILLIDDDMVSREVMATMLTMSGYPVHTAVDGPSALNLLAEQACAPGVILMDAQMPGLSGVELIGELRARSQARLYVISASQSPDGIATAADGFLLKPFSPDSLTRLIADHEAAERPAKPAGLDPGEAVLNPQTLAQLREMMPETAVRQIYEAVSADLDRRTVALENAANAGDWPEIRRIGHAIKGGAAMAGASQVSRIAALVESGALEPSSTSSPVNQVDNSASILADLRAAALNLQRMLNAEFKA